MGGGCALCQLVIEDANLARERLTRAAPAVVHICRNREGVADEESASIRERSSVSPTTHSVAAVAPVTRAAYASSSSAGTTNFSAAIGRACPSSQHSGRRGRDQGTVVLANDVPWYTVGWLLSGIERVFPPFRTRAPIVFPPFD